MDLIVRSLLPCAVMILGVAAGPAGASAKEEIVEGLSRIRARAYREQIAAGTMRPDRVRAFLLRKLREEYDDETLDAERRAMVHFGFLEPRDDLKGIFVAMLSDQAAGFYDPDARRLFLVEGKPFAGMALIHEMTHALQDQVFGIGQILRRARGSDDTLLAAQAMIEGEATALTEKFIAAHGQMTIVGDDGSDRDGAGDGGRGDVTPRIPSLMRSAFAFPYVEGAAWARAIDARGGNALMDEVFLRPPDSTEQILHPDRTEAPRDLPSVIDPGMFESLTVDLSVEGYRLIRSNVMGEFTMRELFGGTTEPQAVAAADGWDGDLYAIYKGPEPPTAMIWVAAWDTPADAQQFRDRAAVWLAGRHPDGRMYRIGLAGREPKRVVRVIEGFGPDLAGRIETLLDRALPAGVSFR